MYKIKLMIIKGVFLFAILLFGSCDTPTQFTEKAFNETLVSLDNSSTTLKEVIHQYKGKKVLIDIWASWCADCVKGLPKVKALQKEFPEVIFLFLSVDEKNESWKKGIERFQIIGQHYNLPKGMQDGDFVDFVDLNWIPRYMVIDETGFISLFKATKASDKNIEKALKRRIFAIEE